MNRILKLTCIVLFLFSFSQKNFAETALKGQVNPDQKVYWLTFFKAKWDIIDSVKADKDGNFHFTNLGKVHGLYKLKSSDIERNFLWAGEETTVKAFIKESLPVLDVSSRENELYSELIKITQKWSDTINMIQQGLSLVDYYHPFVKTKTDSVERLMLSETNKYTERLRGFRKTNKGTMAGDVFAPMLSVSIWTKSSPYYKMYDNANSFAHYHFLDNMHDITPLKSKITVGDLLYNKLHDYFSGYCIKSVDGFKDASDIILKSFEDRTDIYNLLLENMAAIFEKKGPPDVFLYLSDTYMSKCEAEDNFKSWIDQADLIKKLKVGNPAPEISMLTTDSQVVKLSNLRGKKVLVYFWSASCSHCQEEVPRMASLYKRLKDKNFEIYGVSLDENPHDWKTFSAAQAIEWINVCDFKKWKTAAAEAYNIKGTPYNYLIDEKGMIMAKGLTMEGIFDLVAGK